MCLYCIDYSLSLSSLSLSLSLSPLSSPSPQVTYYDEMKEVMADQAQRNRKEFEGLPHKQRQAYIGVEPGTYIRVEISVSHVACHMTSHMVM